MRASPAIRRNTSSGLLWQIAYSDDRLEEHEEYLIRKIAKLLHIDHSDFIAEKLKAKEAKAKT